MLGEGALHAFEYRMHDTRIGRFWSFDPLAKDYPMLTPFQFASCSPMLLKDVECLEGEGNTVSYTAVCDSAASYIWSVKGAVSYAALTVCPNPTDNLLHIELSGAEIATVSLYGRTFACNVLLMSVFSSKTLDSTTLRFSGTNSVAYFALPNLNFSRSSNPMMSNPMRIGFTNEML